MSESEGWKDVPMTFWHLVKKSNKHNVANETEAGKRRFYFWLHFKKFFIAFFSIKFILATAINNNDNHYNNNDDEEKCGQ